MPDPLTIELTNVVPEAGRALVVAPARVELPVGRQTLRIHAPSYTVKLPGQAWRALNDHYPTITLDVQPGEQTVMLGSNIAGMGSPLTIVGVVPVPQPQPDAGPALPVPPAPPKTTRTATVRTEAELRAEASKAGTEVVLAANVALKATIDVASDVAIRTDQPDRTLSIGPGKTAIACAGDRIDLFGLRFATIDGRPGKGGGCIAIEPRGARDVCVRYVTFADVETGVLGNGGPTRVAMDACGDEGPQSIRSYAAWWGVADKHATDVAMTACHFTNSTREHIVRCGGVTRLHVRDCKFTNVDLRPADPLDYAKSVVWVMRGEDVTIEDNEFVGDVGIGRLENGDDVDRRDEVRRCVVRRNRIRGQLQHHVGSTGTIVEGNAFVVPPGRPHIRVAPYNPLYGQGVVDPVDRDNTVTVEAAREAGIVLGWAQPQDQTPAEKARRTRLCGTSVGRAYVRLDNATNLAAKRDELAAQAVAGIRFVVCFNPPADPAHPSHGWRGVTPAKVAAAIHEVAPPDATIALLNEVGWYQHGNRATPYWPITGDLTATYRTAVAYAVQVATELRAFGRTDVAAPSVTNPTPEQTETLCAVVNELDPTKAFGRLNLHLYDKSAADARAVLAVYRRHADAIGRTVLIDEWGASAATFADVLAVVCQGADLSCYWLGWDSPLDKAGTLSDCGLLDAAGNPTPRLAAWQRVTGQLPK